MTFFRTLLLILGAASPALGAEQPNIIFMLSDDQAWAGLSVRMDPDNPQSASLFEETPNLEALAARGARFSHAYAPAPVCSPTRASIQTGMTPAALHWTKAGPTVGASAGYPLMPPRHDRSLDPRLTTIGEMLQSAGYRTAHLGKWHLSGGGPSAHGYDISDGDTGNGDSAALTPPDPLGMFSTMSRAEAFMSDAQSEGRPFYLQISFYALHDPQNALPETLEKYRAKAGKRAPERKIARAAIAQDMDTAIGRLMESLNRLGLSRNTYVIFMSDNGAGGRNGMLRGGKGALFEGGIRVPFIIAGPDIPHGAVLTTPISGTDMFATFADMAGAPQSMGEGGSILPVAQGHTDRITRSTSGLVFHFPHYQDSATPQSAIIHEGWKLIRYYDGTPPLLFDLSRDPVERTNLAQSDPKQFLLLSTLLSDYLQRVDAQLPARNTAQ